MEGSKHLRAAVTAELVEKKSRFIAYLTPVTSEEEALAFISSIKKKHYDARHNCSAYIVGNVARSSDDGEPSHTAGRPMMDALVAAGLSDVCVVVTRYFGGILLGTGGLVRAYKGAVNEALLNADIYELVKMAKLGICLSYPDYGKVSRMAGENGEMKDCGYGLCAIRNLAYGENVSFNLYCQPENTEKIIETITNLTLGQATIDDLGFEEL